MIDPRTRRFLYPKMRHTVNDIDVFLHPTVKIAVILDNYGQFSTFESLYRKGFIYSQNRTGTDCSVFLMVVA